MRILDASTMFGYFETPESFKAASVTVDEYEASLKWHEFMRPFFEAVAKGSNGEPVLEIELEEVFHWINVSRAVGGGFYLTGGA